MIISGDKNMEHLELNFACAGLDQLENPEVKGLFDLTIEHQVQLLEYLKKYKDIERGKIRGKGFGNCQFFNHKRDPRVFTFLESEFAKLAENFNVQFNHEVRVKCKDRLNRWHTFKLDFLEPTKRVNVEVSPNWHKNYILVVKRDIMRKRLLEKHGIESLTVPVIPNGPRGHIDYAITKKILRYIVSLTPSAQSLDHWVTTESLTKGVKQRKNI
jgi:hypothetical protein